jgi:hypothetical protein
VVNDLKHSAVARSRCASTLSRTRALVLVATIITLAQSLPSTAALLGRATGATQVSTSSWSLIVFKQGQQPTTGPYEITWSQSGGTAYDYISLRNNGSETINSFSLVIALIQKPGGKASDVTLELCNSAWNTTNNSCTGTATTIGTAADSRINRSGLTLLSNSTLNLRASTPAAGRNNLTVTLSTEVSRAGIRAGTLRN